MSNHLADSTIRDLIWPKTIIKKSEPIRTSKTFLCQEKDIGTVDADIKVTPVDFRKGREHIEVPFQEVGLDHTVPCGKQEAERAQIGAGLRGIPLQ